MSTAATNVYGKNWRDGKTYHDWNALDTEGIALITGAGYNNQNWVTAIRFELPGYAGKLSFSWCTATEHSGKGTLNYKLTRQEEPDLINADHSTPGDGSLSPMQYDYTRNTLEIEQILSPGTYYLYLWSGKDGGGYTSVYWRSNGTYKATLTYDDIPGTASTLALSGGVLGQPVTMQITRNNADFVHTLNWSFGGQSGVIAEKTADTLVTWTPDADTFGAYIPTASSGVLTVSCTTYYDEEQIGTAQTATLTLSVPSDAAPVLHDGWAAVSHTNDGTAAAGLSACIAGYSKAVAAFDSSKVTAKYGAAIKTLTAAMGGSSVTGSGTIGTVSGTGNTVTLTATDSRGKKTSQNVTLSAYAYSMPVLGGVTVFRCSSAGTEDDGGAYYSAKATVTYSTAGGKISCALTAAVKAVGGSYGTAAALTPGTASVLGGGLSATVSYVVRIRAVDSLGNAAVVEVMIPTAAVAFHIPDGGNGLGFGKYNEADGYVDSAWPVKMNGNRIAGLGEPTEDSDALTRGYADGAYAPSLFGFTGRESMPENSDLNSYTTVGTYGVGSSATANTFSNMPVGLHEAFSLHVVDKFSGNHPAITGSTWLYGWQEIKSLSGYLVRRSMDTNYSTAPTFGAWEWVNPPMAVGVEYRTTERWNGKAVYTVLVNCGNMPNNTTKSVSISAYGIEMLLECYGVMSSGNTIPYSWLGEYMAEISASRNNIYLYTTADFSDNTAHAVLKYTKA